MRRLFGGSSRNSSDDGSTLRDVSGGTPRRGRGFSSDDEGSITTSRTTSTGSLSQRPPGSWTPNQAKMERIIANHSRQFGEGVQTIVATAKAKGTDDWKTALLDLLGQQNTKSDIDILIQNHIATNFAKICLEHELPPNLVHCLRLLRVLELQNASTPDAKPLSIIATNKVSRLLILLCQTDTTIGDQLRPHLFGLFALSGASYPSSGVHVAAAAASVIANYPLTANTVWFIHDRKMLIHMTDDVKELASTEPKANVVPCGLTGKEAEQAGLIVIALSTVVKLVYESLKFKTVDLVKDFTVAGGFQVMEQCLLSATGKNGRAMLELLPMLACCPQEILVDSDNEPVQKLACNNFVLDMFADLLTRSNPLLRRRRQEDKDIWRELINLKKIENLYESVKESMESAAAFRLEESKPDLDLDLQFPLSADFMGVVLQLFADNPNNYGLMELRLHILTYSMIAFPCFQSYDTKVMIMKTLELVMTSVGPSEEMMPVYACIEVFFALADITLKGEADPKLLEKFQADAELMGTTLEKLLEFDQSVAPMFVDSGLWDLRLSQFLDALNALPEKNELPPVRTSQDKPISIVCRVQRLLVASQPLEPSKSEDTTQIQQLLQISVRKMGIPAVLETTRVYETCMLSFGSRLQLDRDMKFALNLQQSLADLVVRYPRNPLLLKRMGALISMMRSVLEEKRISRYSFRNCEGFDVFLSTILCMKNVFKSFDLPDFPEFVWELLQNQMGLLDAAIGMKARNSLQANEIYPLSIPGDVCADCISSQLSSESASSLNRNYLREKGFYLDFAAAIAAMGLLESQSTAEQIVELVMAHMDPDIQATSDVKTLRNPDASRLVLGVCTFMPNSREGNDLAINTVDELLRLCEPDMAASSLSDLSSCGLCLSLTSPNEFGMILFDTDHSLQSRFLRLLTLIAAQSMSYMDFVSLLRNVAGPMLAAEDGTVRLPVISSSIRKQASVTLKRTLADAGNRREAEHCLRLETICEIARKADRFPRICLGGDSVNTIAVLMHEVRLEERLKAAAEEGRLRFLEIESIDATASTTAEENEDPGVESMWMPLSTSGFTFSLWMRHSVPIGSSTGGNLHILDMFNVSGGIGAGSNEYSFLSVWYDLQNQRFNVMSSAAYRGEPTCFPVSPLTPDAWHHVMITYTPAKRSMIARKSAFSVYVDGRPLEADVRVESVNLPPSAKVVIGAPNPALAMSGVVRGILPVWELGPSLMLSTVLLELDATSIYAYGPSFPSLLWGDRPQRLSLTATATAMFSMLAETGEAGSVGSALRRRDIVRLENAGMGNVVNAYRDALSTANLLCNLPPDCVVFGFQASTINSRMRNEAVQKKRALRTRRLVNVARLNFASDIVSTDAVVYGRNSVIAPTGFMDCLRWVSGPQVLMPLVNAATSAESLKFALQLIRLGSKEHRPNLEMLQAGGGYRILSVLLQSKGVVDELCLDQCFAFAVHGFDPDQTCLGKGPVNLPLDMFRYWVFSDLEAMKHLMLNHQVWELRKYGPAVPTRLLSYLNLLVHHAGIHKAFNARRLHQLGIVQWTLHLAIEAAELYAANDTNTRKVNEDESQKIIQSSLWNAECPDVAVVSVGGDPGNAFLLECKTLLRRVLTFMLTPKDLESLVECIMYTVNIGADGMGVKFTRRGTFSRERRMIPSATLRLHLVRLLEELMVDGVNEIVASGRPDAAEFIQSHAGGVASFGQPYFTTAYNRGKTPDGKPHPKHQQAQSFLSAFSAYLTPIWFASVLEGCQEEASASALVRLMVLMIQGSASFEDAFREAGSFAPFVLSVPRYSTCPGIAISLLSQLLNVPILHIHSLPSLNPDQLCEVFDTESIEADYDLSFKRDPASGVFALLVECIGRNVHIALESGDDAKTATSTNEAIVHLLVHRHTVSQSFRVFCHSLMFLEPLAQALCLVYQENAPPRRKNRQAMLADVPKGLSPTERFIGSIEDPDSTGMGIVRLIRLIVGDAVNTCARAASIVYSIFRSFPIHASPQQVAAFHLVLIEHCCAVIDTVLQGSNADAMVISNCIGICSVFVDHEIGAFFTSEAAMKTVSATISILNALLRFDTPAIYSMSNSDHSMLTRDASYIANLACVAALRIGLPFNPTEHGDEDLQAMVLDVMDEHISSLLLLPSRDRKSNWKIPTGKPAKPAQNSKIFDIWASASISRCLTNRSMFFPDYFSVKDPELVTIAPMLVSLHRLLVGSRDDVRSLSVSIFVALLEHRSSLLGELLVTEVRRNGKIETIDIVSRGGFKALLAAHEAASADGKTTKTANINRKYSTFFDWFERCQDEVQLVFNSLEKKAKEACPGLQETSSSQEETVENEQKLMLMRLTAESGDRTMIGGLERAEIARFCFEKTSEIHGQWKRQGFDHLAFGAMKWKFLLRQLKGSSSIWEGGPLVSRKVFPTLEDSIRSFENKCPLVDETPSTIKRWKLDLTEGYERQRRRLLPNYEFHGLYNLEEEHDVDVAAESAQDDAQSEATEIEVVTDFLVSGGEMEATAALLKDLNIKRAHRNNDDDDDYDKNEENGPSDSATVATTASGFSESSAGMDPQANGVSAPIEAENEDETQELNPEEKDSSSYELITGLLQAGDWPVKSYNVKRCTGLEVTKALLLWCGNAIYIIDGFEQTGGDGMEGKITRVERERTSFHINLRPKNFKVKAEGELEQDVLASAGKNAGSQVASKKERPLYEGLEASADNIIYEHRSQRILLTDLYSVYRRRYQLQQTGLEFYDVHRNSALIAFASHADREEILSKVLHSNIPNSIFSSSLGSFISYTKFMQNRKAKITLQWQSGKLTNFEYLMELNSLAGRSFNDLTAYPVFPWVIADYDSEEIDLNDPATYRDLSKPMGAIGSQRATQFRERYEALASTYFGEDDPPPFHYGTHYSCAAYVLYYLMRLEPFSRLALSLQGGRFDVADRLFHDVGRSWRSASSENLQDVRELIPEFYYLPDFLVNTNHFDFGETQRGKTVHDVTLPKWAKDDPRRFVRINRQALESEYVSKNLHLWLDLVFGYKQRGEEAIECLNTFVHVTYEGEVDIDAMTDPVQRQSTIAQIQNFGQTPSRLERRPFPQRVVVSAVKENAIDFSSLAALTHQTPPLCVVGAPSRIRLAHVTTEQCRIGRIGVSDTAVGEISYAKGQLLAVPKLCALVIPTKKYFSFGGVNNGVTVHAAAITARFREVNKLLSIHDDMHRAPIVTAKASLDGNWLVTGSVDSTIRVWSYDGTQFFLEATFCGHDGSRITCLDVSVECGVIVSGCSHGRVLLWDLRTLTFVRALQSKLDNPTLSASINNKNGNIVALGGSKITVFDINGGIVAEREFSSANPPTCAVATDCPEWMEEGIAVVTGHQSGEVRLFSIDYDRQELVYRLIVESNPHTSPITALRVTGAERQDTLLVGDASGKVSVFKSVQLDTFTSAELDGIANEITTVKNAYLYKN